MDSIRFGYDPMFYRMEKIEDSPKMESLETVELLSPAKDIPSWALRDTQPQPQGTTLQEAEELQDKMGTLAECNGCIAEQGIRHTCGHQEDSDYGSQCSLSSAQHNGHAVHTAVTTAPSRWEPITSPDFGEYTLTLATLGSQVHTTEDVSVGVAPTYPQNKTVTEQSEQGPASYQVVQEAIQPKSCPHSYPLSHTISPRSTHSQNKEPPQRSVANRAPVLSPEDGTISCQVINTSGAAVVRRQRPVTLTQSFTPTTLLSTIHPQSPVSGNTGVRSYVYSDPPKAHTPKQGKVSTDRLSTHVLTGVNPTVAHTVAIAESYQPVLPKLSPDSVPLDLSVSKHDDFTAGLLNLSTKGARNINELVTTVQNTALSLVTSTQVVNSKGVADSHGGYSIPTSSKLVSDLRQSNTQPALIVYGRQPLASSGVVPGQEVRPPDPHVHLEKDFVQLSNTGPPTSTQTQDGVYTFQVQLPGTSTSVAATGPATTTASVTTPPLASSHVSQLQQLQQLHQQQLQKQQLQLNQKEAQSNQFKSTHQILLCSPKDTVPPVQSLPDQATMTHQQQVYPQPQTQVLQQSQNQPLSQQQMQLLHQQQSQQQAQLLQQYQNQQLLQQQLQLQQLQQQYHPAVQLQNPPSQQLLQSQLLQLQQLQLLQQQQQLQPQQLQQLQRLSQLQQFQPIQQQPQRTDQQQLQSSQTPQLQQQHQQQAVLSQQADLESKTQPEAISTQQNQETKTETANEERPSPISSQDGSPQHKPSSNNSSPSKSHSRRDQRRSITGQEKEALGTVFGATQLYGKPAWWGDDAEDKKEGGEGNGAERPDSLNLDQPPDMSKYKTDPKYAVTYMEIPGNDGSPEKESKDQKTSPKTSPDVPPPPSMAFTIDMGEAKVKKGPRISMEAGLSKFLPNKVRKTFQSRVVSKKEDEKLDETSTSSAPGNPSKSQPHKSPGPRRKSGYHSDGHQSNVSSDNEDLSIRSDTVTTRTAGKKTTPTPGPPSTAKSTSGINRERTFTVMKHSKAPRDATRAVKSKTPTPRKAEKPPRDARQRSHTAVPMTSSGQMSDGGNYLIEKMFSSQSGRPSVGTSKRAPVPDSSEYVLYREAKAYDAKIAALSEPLTPPPIIDTLAVPKTGKSSSSSQDPTKAQQNAARRLKSKEGIPDNISEAGTYTIEADQSTSRDEDTARKSIDKAFGLKDPINLEDAQLTEDEEEEIKDEVADDGLMEGKLRRLAEEKKRTNTNMTDSLEVEADGSHYQEEAEEVEFRPPDLTELSGDTPKWMRHWTTSPSGAKVTTRPAPPKFTPAAPLNKDINQGENGDKPGARRHRRKLPTPPIKSGGSTPSTPRSGADLTSPRALTDLSFKPVSFDGVFADDLHEDQPTHDPSQLLRDSELFIPIPHQESDSEDSHRLPQHNGYPLHQPKSVPKSAPGLESKKPPKPLGSRETTTPRDKPLSSTPRDKVFKSFSSRTKRGHSLPHDMDDSMDLRSESEASIVSTSTDYSECQGSPRAKRKTAKSPISNLAKTNRAFALRRARLEASESEPSPRTPRGSDTNLSRSTRIGSGGKGGVKLKSSVSNRADTNRPNSAQGHRSDYVSPALAKHARDNQVRAKSAGPGPINRSDGGRFSLRTGKASPTPTAKKTDTKPKSKSPAVGGIRLSPGLAKPKADSRSNSPRTEEHNAWQRRKTYDPRRAVAEAKAAKTKGGKTDPSISVDSSESDLRSKSVPLLTTQLSNISISSEGEDSFLSEDRSYARASSGRLTGQGEIGRLSHELTRDLHEMARNIDADSLAADVSLQGYDAVVISSIYQLSLKVKTQTERLMEQMQDEYRLSNSPSPTEEIASQSDAIPNQELAGILRNLRHAEQKLQRIDRGMFPQSSTCAATNGSPQNHQQYLRELERIRTEIAGFKPIDTPTAMPPSSRSRNPQPWRTTKQDPFPGDDFY